MMIEVTWERHCLYRDLIEVPDGTDPGEITRLADARALQGGGQLWHESRPVPMSWTATEPNAQGAKIFGGHVRL